MSAQDRATFERDGFVVVPGVLDADEIATARAAMERARRWAAASGELGPDGSLHQLSAVSSCPDLAFLLDHPRVFGHVWSVLGWNVHVYHSHVDIHPPIRAPRPDWWHWHQDGGRQNRELETDPRPRMSVKVAYWLSDVSVTGRGNLTLIPGSHLVNWLPGPPRRDVPWPAPTGAIQVTANPGDAVFFDRRIWHARSDNHSDITRMAVFFGYTYRWVAVRDDVADLPYRPEWADRSPVQRQLLGGSGDGTGDDLWGHYPQKSPLYTELAGRGLLDAANPPLMP